MGSDETSKGQKAEWHTWKARLDEDKKLAAPLDQVRGQGLNQASGLGLAVTSSRKPPLILHA